MNNVKNSSSNSSILSVEPTSRRHSTENLLLTNNSNNTFISAENKKDDNKINNNSIVQSSSNHSIKSTENLNHTRSPTRNVTSANGSPVNGVNGVNPTSPRNSMLEAISTGAPLSGNTAPGVYSLSNDMSLLAIEATNGNGEFSI